MRSLFLAKISAFLGCLVSGMSLFAVDISITTLDDSGAGSLREAMTNAIEGDLLLFDNLSGTITLLSPLPDITASYSIYGPTGNTVVIDGNSQHQIFNIAGGGVPTISDLTLVGGDPTIDGGFINIADEWWAVLNNITVDHCNGSCGYPVYIGLFGYLQTSNLVFANGSNVSGKGIYMDNAALSYSLDDGVNTQCMVDGIGGNFLKYGEGTLSLGAVSNPTDITLVAYEGNLDFNGNTLQPALAIFDGTYSGDSFLYYLVNYGVVKPGASLGNGIGSISMTGDFMQLSAGQLQIGIESTGECDFLQVAGNINLDGQLYINAGAGSFTTGTIFTILYADGGINGTFASVDCSDPVLEFNVNYNAQSIEVEIL